MAADLAQREEPLPAYLRARADLRLRFAAGQRRTQLIDRADGGGYLVRVPAHPSGPEGHCEAVIVNTGGGMAGGDRLALAIEAGPGAGATITTQTAEKIYRAQGPATEIEIKLRLSEGSRLDWLPQETILFSGSRCHRRLTAELTGDARLTIAETVIFGRRSMGESVATGSFRDRWRLVRDGRLIYAEDVALPDQPARRLAQAASGRGAAAVATILHIGGDAESRLDAARACLASAGVEAGASAWDGMLLVKFVAADAQALRVHVVAMLAWLRGAGLPRSW
jgi:urease accessory protein